MSYKLHRDNSRISHRNSKEIGLVKLQYSGAEHGLVQGIGVINIVHSDGKDYNPVDYRIYAPNQDGKTKKDNRLISLTKEGGYVRLEEIIWTEEMLTTGIEVKLKELPFKVRLFKLVATDGNIDWIITNGPDRSLTREVVCTKNDVLAEDRTISSRSEANRWNSAVSGTKSTFTTKSHGLRIPRMDISKSGSIGCT